MKTKPNFCVCPMDTEFQYCFFKWANPYLFLFIFVLFNNNLTEKL